jgi:hypothetical protein
MANALVQLGKVGGAFVQHLFVGTRAKGCLAFFSECLGIRHQEEVLEFLLFSERGVDGLEREVLKLAVGQECTRERVNAPLVQDTPQKVVVAMEPVHHGCEMIGDS